MKKSLAYKTKKNPPTIEMPIRPVDDSIAFEEKDNKKTIKMKKIETKDTKKSEDKEESAAPLLLGVGFLAVIGFGLWAVSRRSPSPALMTQGPGFQQHLHASSTNLAGLPVSIIPSQLTVPNAPTWNKTGRQQIEVPDGSQRPSQSNTRRPGQGTGQGT